MKIDQIIRTRRKSIALIIQRDGKLVVRAPMRASAAQIQAFVEQKSEWIRKTRQKIEAAYPKSAPKQYVNGERFWFLGQTYPLKIVQNARLALELGECFCLDQSALPAAKSVFAAWYKTQARQILSERVARIATQSGFVYKQVKITSAQTRWGSCSASASLNFSWRLVMAPLPVIDYVVIHELVHTLERNHRQPFWTKVEAIDPDYKQKTAWLDINASLLTL